MRSLLLSLLILVGLMAVSEAQACSFVIEERAWEDVLDSDVLFLGRVVKAEEVITVLPWVHIPARWFRSVESSGVSVTFEVERWWRGGGKRHVRVIIWKSICELLPQIELGALMFVDADRVHGANYSYVYRSTPSGSRVLAIVDGFEVVPGQKPVLSESDSLYLSLGTGFEPSNSRSSWFILMSIFGIAGLLFWRYRKRGLASEGDA